MGDGDREGHEVVETRSLMTLELSEMFLIGSADCR